LNWQGWLWVLHKRPSQLWSNARPTRLPAVQGLLRLYLLLKGKKHFLFKRRLQIILWPLLLSNNATSTHTHKPSASQFWSHSNLYLYIYSSTFLIYEVIKYFFE
jgi:hypothetical protein